jgi:signal transduction histidine kinase
LKTKLGLKEDKKVSEMLNLIEDNIRYSDKIIGDLLEYSKETRLELVEITPKSIIQEALSAVKIPKRIRIVNMVKSRPKLRVDKEKMRRVFINIIKNALDAMPKGGTLTIETKTTGDDVAFNVSDTGVGMSKETLRKLWSPLFTTKAKGMGFGLSICRRLVEAHGGRINVESHLGSGTKFTIAVSVEPKSEGGERIWVNVPEYLSSTTTRAYEKH